MALRFPDVYRDVESALAESRRLNEWIEAVLSASPSGRMRAVSGGAEVAGRDRGGRQMEWGGAPPEKLTRRRRTRSM
jgi:ATP-dependent RNA helicase SUPV3L1/SUV3